jgi:small subunit ribosomal protein S16
MLRIRLSRTGKKKQSNYRIVVANVEAKRDGRVVERIGHYNPRTEPVDYRIDESRALYWLSVGAQPSDAVQRLLVKQGTIERLGRLREGEPLDSLIAEFDGTPAETRAADENIPADEIAADETIDDVVEEVAALVEDVETDEEE